MTLRILLADDHPLTRAGLAHWLQAHSRGRLQVHASVASTDALLEALHGGGADLLICDYYLPGGSQADGLALLAQLRQAFARLPVLVLTALSEACALGGILASGAAGLVNKRAPLAELLKATLQVANGRRYVCRHSQAILAERYLAPSHWPNEGRCVLSERETEVMALARAGLTIPQMAARLGRSAKAIAVQRRNAFDKLGLRAEALIYHGPEATGGSRCAG
ncbi:response regulator [Pseudomonas sp. NPDC007930]|uniref:response regulator n=1 Tax=Pseudomonas sp. NPDC007930 TaxID=3364417 RepID=UPI0036E001C6